MTSVPDAETLRTIAARVDAAASVARRSSGAFGGAAAYLPGERIEGVRLRDSNILEIHVVMRWAFTVDDVEHDVLEAVGGLWAADAVTLVIDDIDVPARAASLP